MKINENYANLQDSYLFATIAKKVNAFKAANPDKNVIRLGIGDVTRPLAPAVIETMLRATLEMGDAKTFRGYCDGEERGYMFLRRAVQGYYAGKNVALDSDEIFISDGAKSDIGNILDIFSQENTVLIPDPVYPVYVDTNIMAGRKIIYAAGNAENGFLPMPNARQARSGHREHISSATHSLEGRGQRTPAFAGNTVDIIYLCSPNNPTGAVYSREQLARWVEYANETGAVILFDSAYEIFVQDETLPTSIFEIQGAETCAIEFCSFSKTAGFTGVRCGYTVIPNKLVRGGEPLNKLWYRRQTTKYNGVPYIVQRGAEAVFTPDGMTQIKEIISYYMQNAKIISDTLAELGIWHTGGKNAPYIWLKCPGGKSSWEFFDHLLENANVVGTPGAGFGENGEGFFRLTAFGEREDVELAMKNMKQQYEQKF